MKYSVITTIYNDNYDAISLLENIFNQSFLPSEVIIVDGGSKDETISLIKKYLTNNPVKVNLICGGRLNVSQGLNLAIRSAKEDYIAIVACGNKYHKDYFKKLFEAIVNEKLDYAYSPIWGQTNTAFSKLYNEVILKGDRGIDIGIPSNHGVVFSRKVLEELGDFYEYFVFAGEDLELYSKLRNHHFIGRCIFDAKLEWDTPQNLSQYHRQVKNYTIAKMQIYSLLDFFKSDKRNFLYIIIVLLGGVLSVTSIDYIGYSLLFIIVFCNFLVFYKKGLMYVLFKNYSFVLPYYYMFKYLKYFGKKYKVNNCKYSSKPK